ncbi:hypothetical protein DEO72_LG3g1939 [Vigna unguiculata]|uniref:Uncharacterized protein n=1 Tax=Vigna unguiculata TaxID=3917 RepID=A0A4D6LGF7_VIGUN|nr:hypothetical protein DEO72_LG3g1939 [Vigna unguiculata]
MCHSFKLGYLGLFQRRESYQKIWKLDMCHSFKLGYLGLFQRSHSFSMETNAEDGVITITPCKTKQDCIRHIRTVGCSASVVYCSQGYCRCNHMSGNSFPREPLGEAGVNDSK